jgi:DNA-binding CsgD family transcriptional regulator
VLETLTQSEWRVVALVARGWTNREVAHELSLRTKTVEWTLTNVYRKLRLRSRTELAVEVARLGQTSIPGIPPGRGARASAYPTTLTERGGAAMTGIVDSRADRAGRSARTRTTSND